ncbi:MAG: hypothetical protein KJ060_14055, partial [Candidatus Hydrogenedentes bacterium]|nr:hypothetical protein [Candidatus Hydrogenedentota bacterium]
MRNLAYDGSALFSVLCMLAVVPAVPEVSLDTIFGVQAAEAELMDSSNFTLTIEGQLFGESSTEKSRQVFNVERASRNVFCQYEWYSSVTRIAFEDAQSSSGDEISNVFPIPSVATGRALVLTDYALV